MFCICSNIKASISLTVRGIRNGLKSNGSAHFQGYCSFEMALFEDSGSNFILLNSEITEAFLKYSVGSIMASQCTVSLLCTKLEGLVAIQFLLLQPVPCLRFCLSYGLFLSPMSVRA